MDIPGIPESITRDKYRTLLSAAGLVAEDLRSLEFRADGIYAEVLAKDESGRTRIDRANNEVVIHRVFIPVDDPA